MRQYTVGDEPIPGYRLTRFLGVGGYGQVWAANGPHAMDYALKILSVTGTRGGKELRGVGLVKKLRHPNLVPLYGYWLKDEFGNYIDGAFSETQSLLGEASELIIAMGLADKSLAQRLDEVKKEGLEGIPLEELLNYMSGAAKAIDFLNQPVHQFGSGQGVAIQHCDIKPGNLLIVGNEIQICDYGLARAIAPDVRVTAGPGAATQAYSAPELLANRPSDHTDQYSLAISYYELRTGKLPFDENEALHAHIKGKLDFSLVGPGEQAALQRAANVDPDKRFPKVGAFLQALREATRIGSNSDAPAGSGPPSPTPSGGHVPILDERIRAGAELVPEHELVSLLGRGGYGEVWKAVGPGGMPCALKIVRNIEGTQGRQEYRSLDLVRELDHERLIRLRAYWLLAKDGTAIPYKMLGTPGSPEPHALVMATDLADKSLLQYWQEKQKEGRAGIGVPELVRIVRQSAEAIDYLNERDILHRDIKPENILLTKDMKVKISDFGLAKFIEGAGAAIHQASVGLTLAYAAPEMFDNRVTRWTDQYALALTYYRLRTGNFPFPNEFGPRQMMMAHTEGKLEFAGVRPEEERVLRRATSLEPQARYPKCLSMVEALEQAHGLSSANIGTSSTTHPGEFTIPSASGVRVGGRKSDARQTLIQDYPPNTTKPEPDSQTEPFLGEVAVTAASDSQVMAELQHKAAVKTMPRADLQVTVIPELLDVVQRPGQREHRPIPTPNLDEVFHSSTSAKRKRLLTGAGIAAAVGIVVFGAYLAISRSSNPPASSAPSSALAQNNSSTPPGSTDKVDPNAGKVDSGAGKDQVNPPPATTPDPLAILQEDVNKNVDRWLKDGNFAAAANAVQQARKQKASKEWADRLDAQIVAQWRSTASSADGRNKRIEEYAKLLKSYPNDGPAKSAKESLETELAHSATFERYHTVLKGLNASNLAQTRSALAELQKQPISDLQNRIRELSSKLDAYEIDRKLPPTLATLDTLASKHDAFAKSSADEHQPLPALYRDLWDDNVRRVVPGLDVAKDPAKTATTLGRLPTPWGAAARSEAVTELLRTGKRVPDAERVMPSDEAAPELLDYRRYVAATRTWYEKSDDAAAETLAGLIPATDAIDVVWLSPGRQARLVDGLVSATETKRQRTDPAAPFKDPEPAYRWLSAADRLANRPKSPIAKEQRLRLRLDLALAALTKSQPDLPLGRQLTDVLVTKDSLDALQLPVPEMVQLWAMHARARDTNATGRARAVESYTKALELLRDDLAGVPVHFLATEIVQPLDRDNGRALLGSPIAQEMNAPAAQLCADAARNVFRYREEWAKEIGRDRSPLDIAGRLLDRAAQLDKKAEYLAWHGIVLLEQPRYGPAEIDRAAADAAGALAADTRYCGGLVLDGAVKAARGKEQSDVRDRLKQCTEANEQFKMAESLCGKDHRSELVFLFQRAADNDIQLATLSSKQEEMNKHLDRAKSRAERLLELEPQRLEIRDTLGCTLEDQAWLVKGDNRLGPDGLYAQAVTEFTRALGGFGERVKPRLDRGRCRYKWAEDEFASRRQPEQKLDESRLNEAKGDLSDVVSLAPESNDAIEAHYWLAKIERLHYRSLPVASPKRVTLHAAAVSELESALRVARDLQNKLWGEPIAQDLASAALEEATRLRDTASPNAPAAVDSAKRAIEALKPYSEPWHAYLRILILPLERKLDSAYYEELQTRSTAGLGPCRQQDRLIQFYILVRRAEERAFFSTPPAGEDFNKALADARAALAKVEDAGLDDSLRGYAIGMMGLARTRLFLKATGEDRINLADKARTDLFDALKKAPQSRAAWQWNALLGLIEKLTIDDKLAKDSKEFEKPRVTANYFTAPYNFFREAEQGSAPINAHEKSLADFIAALRADFEKKAPDYLRKAIQIDSKDPDRFKWQLTLAEMLVRAGGASNVAEARTLLAAALDGLPAANQKTHVAQVDRIRQALAKAEK
jgi:serine/threonine protein kinase